MPLTRSFEKLVHEHAAADPAFAEALERCRLLPSRRAVLMRRSQ
jgi:hypothetical protein